VLGQSREGAAWAEHWSRCLVEAGEIEKGGSPDLTALASSSSTHWAPMESRPRKGGARKRSDFLILNLLHSLKSLCL
jgi:hypothetical protein